MNTMGVLGQMPTQPAGAVNKQAIYYQDSQVNTKVGISYSQTMLLTSG
jgi:hypothetical protein